MQPTPPSPVVCLSKVDGFFDFVAIFLTAFAVPFVKCDASVTNILTFFPSSTFAAVGAPTQVGRVVAEYPSQLRYS